MLFLGMVLITAPCTMSQTSVHSSSCTLSGLIPWINLSLPLYNCMEFKSYLNGLVVFPIFFNFSLYLAIRRSWYEPHSAPSLVFADCIEHLHLWLQGIINLISVLTIWWGPCVESSLVFLEEGVCYDQCILLAKLLAFALLQFVLQGQICLLLQVSPDFLLLHSSLLCLKGHLSWVLVLEGLIGLHRTVQLQLLQHCWMGHRLGLLC